MSWALKGLAAPLKGKVFNLKPGMTMGRQGDIVVPDTKASAIHTRFVVSEGKWFLADNSSKNGTRINGERIESVIALKAGLKFSIGEQIFEVIEIKGDEESVTRPPVGRINADDMPTPPPRTLKPAPATAPPPPAEVDLPEPDADPDKTAIAAPHPGVAPTEPPPLTVVPEPPPMPEPPPPKKRRYWHELLADFVDENKENFSERKRPVSPLAPALVLEFVRGLQANTKWTLGYGPRKIGPSAIDLPIFEPGAPAVCFEIFSSSEGIMFKTAHPKQVTVNGEPLDSRVLHVGDKIRINETIIEVDFET